MGINCRPMGKLRKDFKRIDRMNEEEQKDFLEAMDYAQATPSLSQAQRLKKFSQEGKCSLDAMCAIMSEEKKSELDKVTIKNDVSLATASFTTCSGSVPSGAFTPSTSWAKRRTRCGFALQT